MLSFITFKDAPEQLEIIADEQGINELIEYLEFVKKSKDHMHLIEGNELDKYQVEGQRRNKTLSAKHVRIEYNSEESWKKIK